MPLDKELGAEELKQLVREAEVSCVIFGRKHEKLFLDMKASGETGLETLVSFDAEGHSEEVLSWKALIEEGKNQVAQGDRQFLDAEIDGDAMAALLYTSGTTGNAKGVMLSHWNLAFDLMSAPTILDRGSGTIFLLRTAGASYLRVHLRVPDAAVQGRVHRLLPGLEIHYQEPGRGEADHAAGRAGTDRIPV